MEVRLLAGYESCKETMVSELVPTQNPGFPSSCRLEIPFASSLNVGMAIGSNVHMMGELAMADVSLS